MTPEQEAFRRSPAHIKALTHFLESETGRALRRLVAAERPAAKLGKSIAGGSVQNLVGMAAAETANSGTAETLVGAIAGFEAAESLVFEIAAEPITSRDPQSRKGGRSTSREISPEPPPGA